VEHAIAFPGLNGVHFTNTPSAAVVFLTLTPATEREHTAQQIAAELNMKLYGIKEGFAFAIMPPPVLGLGTGAGYSLYVEDRANRGDAELSAAIYGLQGAVAKLPGITPPFSTYQPNVPQLSLSIDREKAKAEGITLTD